MFMLSDHGSIAEYIHDVKEAITVNNLTIGRLDDAVSRIIAVKISMGLVNGATEQPDRVEQGHTQLKESAYEQSIRAVK